MLLQVVGQIFGHALGQRRDEHPLVLLLPQADLAEQVIHLPRHGPDLDGGIHEPGRADDLFDDDTT